MDQLSRIQRALRSGGSVFFHPTSELTLQVIGARVKKGQGLQVRVRSDKNEQDWRDVTMGGTSHGKRTPPLN